MNADERFPWKWIMQFGFGVLGLSAAAFWRMTPRELEAAMSAHYGDPGSGSSLDRDAFTKLMERFPDNDRSN